MPVSERDREYFRRIGEYKAESHAEAAREHLKLSLDERLERSWALYVAHKDEARLAARDRDDDPSAFYERARALGLYQP